jgi:hypothetical protein
LADYCLALEQISKTLNDWLFDLDLLSFGDPTDSDGPSNELVGLGFLNNYFRCSLVLEDCALVLTKDYFVFSDWVTEACIDGSFMFW